MCNLRWNRTRQPTHVASFRCMLTAFNHILYPTKQLSAGLFCNSCDAFSLKESDLQTVTCKVSQEPSPLPTYDCFNRL